MLRRIWFLLPLFATLILSEGIAQAARGPALQATGAVLIDAETGQVLFAKNPHLRLYPASVTKIVTAALAIEHGDLSKPVRVPVRATLVQGNRVYLNAGQVVDRRTLLYGLMLRSGNDAAVALAVSEAGSVRAFVREMNRYAESAGARGTHFTNPDGLPDPRHYTTAYDMALLTRRAWQLPLFRQIVGTQSHLFPVGGKPTEIYNENQLLRTYPGAVGVKTGYTVAADETIVAAARREGTTLIAVVLHTTPSGLWSDPTNLLNWGFAHYRPVLLARRGATVAYWRLDGRVLPLLAGRTVSWLFPVGVHPAVARSELIGPDPAVIRKGQVVGRLLFSVNHRTIASVPLLASRKMVMPHLRGGLSPLWYAAFGFIMGGWLWERRLRRRRFRRIWYTVPHRFRG